MGLRYFLPRRKEKLLNLVAVFVFFIIIVIVYSLLDDTSAPKGNPSRNNGADEAKAHSYKAVKIPAREAVIKDEAVNAPNLPPFKEDIVMPRARPLKDSDNNNNNGGQRQMEHVIPDYSKPRTGPGENGRGVILEGEEKELGQQQMKTWFMNVVAGDKISLDRSIPDSRSADCMAMKYDKDLPKASVVIIFTNEAWAPLMRTVHSVINRSPPEYLHEVVLIDDNSDHEWLKDKLDEHIKRFNGLVRIVRKTVRHGLIRAKIAGAEAATGEVVVFLDSHCEANAGWLEPILQRIKDKRTAVVCPVIDMISDSTMAYMGGAAGGIGTFWWSLHFKMDSIPEKEQKRRKNPATDPLMSPTMAGGLLAADRKYFFEVGAYDPGMDIWGGENLEISFRVWMCGGSIEFLPCSHVGHIFRNGHPYNMTGPRGEDVHGMNSRRLAEVWMDDYKRLYYVQRMGLKDADVGDISERVELRKRLKCHDFKWYLDNIIPEKFIPDENVKSYGLVMNKQSSLCLDTLQRLENKGTIILGVFSCQMEGSSSQAFSMSMKDELRRETTCTDRGQPLPTDKSKSNVIVTECSDYITRVWKHEKDGQLKHEKSGLCLDVDGIKSGDDVILAPCDSNKESQKWSFKTYF